MADRPDILASDAEREHTAVALRDAAGEGRLTLEDLVARLDLAYGARTRGDLVRVTADLPAGVSAATMDRPRPRSRWILAVMSGASRRGRWRPAARTRAVAVMGGCTLDLRQAELTGERLHIDAVSIMGGIDIVVPEGVEVHVSGISIMGGKDVKVADVPPRLGAPLIDVRALTVMGGVSVRSRRERHPPQLSSG